jgi:type IX secretion system PorP/SprF family membrane protein
MNNIASLLLDFTIFQHSIRYILVIKLREISLAALALMSVNTARAQYDPELSHYFDTEVLFNPAAAGKIPKLNIAVGYALQMAGFENNPRTMYVAADMPVQFFKSDHGVSLQLMNDQIGLFTHQRVSAGYNLKTRLFGGTLALGAQVGFLNEAFDGSKVDVDDSSDPALSTTDVNGSGMDIGAGMYYLHDKWYAGLSVQHLNSPLIDLGEKNQLQIDATYYFTCGYNIKLRNPFLTIRTSGLLRTDMTAWRGDLTARLCYTHEQRAMNIGVSYSPDHSVTLLVGGRFHGIMLGYSYEAYTSGISLANGSHELYVGYQIDLNLAKRGRNSHKSVRLL